MNVAAEIQNCHDAFVRKMRIKFYVKGVQYNRGLIAGYNLTEAQVRVYQDRVDGINDRLHRLLGRRS